MLIIDAGDCQQLDHVVRLICPLSFCRIIHPVRGRSCGHRGAFELSVWFSIFEQGLTMVFTDSANLDVSRILLERVRLALPYM